MCMTEITKSIIRKQIATNHASSVLAREVEVVVHEVKESSFSGDTVAINSR